MDTDIFIIAIINKFNLIELRNIKDTSITCMCICECTCICVSYNSFGSNLLDKKKITKL